jgi:hypothetical protein
MFSPQKLSPLSQRLGVAVLAALVLALIASAIYLARQMPGLSPPASPPPGPSPHPGRESLASLAPPSPRPDAAPTSPVQTPDGEISAEELGEQWNVLAHRMSALAEKRRDLRERLHLPAEIISGFRPPRTDFRDIVPGEKARVAELESQCAAIRERTPEDLPELLGILKIEDDSVLEADRRLRECVEEAAALRADGVPSNSIRLRTLEQQIENDRYWQQRQFDNLQRAIATMLDFAKAELANNQKLFDAQLDDERNVPKLTAEYNETEAALTAARRLLFENEKRYEAARLRNNIPRDHIRNWRYTPPQH